MRYIRYLDAAGDNDVTSVVTEFEELRTDAATFLVWSWSEYRRELVDDGVVMEWYSFEFDSFKEACDFLVREGRPFSLDAVRRRHGPDTVVATTPEEIAEAKGRYKDSVVDILVNFLPPDIAEMIHGHLT